MLPSTIHDKWGEMETWTDAYSVTLEANAQAFSDPLRKKQLDDALKSAKAKLAIATDEKDIKQLRELVENQEAVVRTMQGFDIDAFREISARWRLVRTDLLRSGWDMREEIHCQGLPNGNLRANQGKGSVTITWEPSQAHVAMAFFQFVNQKQNEVSDPREYTKRMLMAQGINQQNFHEHADKLAITNPWSPGGIIHPGSL